MQPEQRFSFDIAPAYYVYFLFIYIYITHHKISRNATTLYTNTHEDFFSIHIINKSMNRNTLSYNDHVTICIFCSQNCSMYNDQTMFSMSMILL